MSEEYFLTADRPLPSSSISSIPYNADEILESFNELRLKIIQQLLQDPAELVKQWSKLIPTNLECRHFQPIMGTAYPHYCYYCQMLNHLQPKWPEEQLLRIVSGKNLGRELVIETFPQSLYLEEVNPSARGVALFNRINSLFSCQPQLPDPTEVRYLTGDPQSLETLNNWIIRGMLQGANEAQTLPLIRRLHAYYRCAKVSRLVSDKPRWSNLADFCQEKLIPYFTTRNDGLLLLDARIIKGFFLQIASFQRRLKNALFVHGQPWFESLAVHQQQSRYFYDQIEISCALTLKVQKLNKASLTFKDKTENLFRTYSENAQLHFDLENLIQPFEIKARSLNLIITQNSNQPECSAKACQSNQEVIVITYRLKPESRWLLRNLHHSGQPLLAGSFDLYVWLLLIVSQREIWPAVKSDPILLKWFLSLWLPQDHSRLMQRLDEQRPLLYEEEILECLMNYELRCDAVTYFWSVIKNDLHG